MKKKSEKSEMNPWLAVLVSLIDDIVIIAAVILALWFFQVKLPIWAMALIGLAIGAYVFVRTWAVLPSLRRKKITGAEGMIGIVGEVVETLNPEGVVRIGVEYWKARSVDGDIEPGEDVEILKIERLSLEVRRRISWEP